MPFAARSIRKSNSVSYHLRASGTGPVRKPLPKDDTAGLPCCLSKGRLQADDRNKQPGSAGSSPVHSSFEPRTPWREAPHQSSFHRPRSNPICPRFAVDCSIWAARAAGDKPAPRHRHSNMETAWLVSKAHQDSPWSEAKVTAPLVTKHTIRNGPTWRFVETSIPQNCSCVPFCSQVGHDSCG